MPYKTQNNGTKTTPLQRKKKTGMPTHMCASHAVKKVLKSPSFQVRTNILQFHSYLGLISSLPSQFHPSSKSFFTIS